MQRQRWFELHDQAWFPATLRDLMTEALEAVWNANRTYACIAPLLREAITRSGATRIVDLCSGGGGPWPSLYPQLAQGRNLEVCLTDLYPNERALAQAAQTPGITFRPEPVNAQCVPPDLRGFRTIFSSFHHLDPPAACAILADACDRGEGIAVFEGARRNASTLALTIGVPLLAMQAAATARPVRWRRVLLTWLIPVVPAVLWIDGILSCLRSYSLADLRELTEGLSAPDYAWQIGEVPGRRVAIRYLVGTPVREAAPGTSP